MSPLVQTVLALACWAGWLYLIVTHLDQPITLHVGQLSFATTLGLVIAVGGILAQTGAGLLGKVQLRRQQQQATHVQWKKDQAEVTAQQAGDQVRVLEAKIQTLEAALAKSLGNKPLEKN